MNLSITPLSRLGAVAMLALSTVAAPAQAQKKAVDPAATEAFRLKRFPGISEGAYRDEEQVYTVPAGKRLVITDTYLGMSVPQGQGVVAILAACAPVIDPVNGSCHLHHIVMTPQPDGDSSVTHAAAHSGRIVVEAEETLIVSFSRGLNSGIGSGAVTLLGHLESAN